MLRLSLSMGEKRLRYNTIPDSDFKPFKGNDFNSDFVIAL